MLKANKNIGLLQLVGTFFVLPFSAMSLLCSTLLLLFQITTPVFSTLVLVYCSTTSLFVFVGSFLYLHKAYRHRLVPLLLFYTILISSFVGLTHTLAILDSWYTPLVIISIYCGVLTLVFGKTLKNSNADASEVIHTVTKKISLTTITFIAILIFALYLRLYHLGSLSFWVDETQSIIAAKNFLETGIPYHFADLIYLRAILYTLLNAGAIYFFGLSEFAIRLVPTIFSILTLVVIYRFLKATSPHWIALLGSWLFAASDFALMYARYNRFYIALAFLVTLHVYLFYRGFILKQKKYQIATIAVAILMCGFDAKAIIFLPLSLSFSFLYLYQETKQNQASYRQALRVFLAKTYIGIYTILSTISFLIFNKIDSINTLTGESIKLYRPSAWEWNTPLPGFIEELLYPRLDFYFIHFLYDHFIIIFITIGILTVTLLSKILSQRTALSLADFAIYYVAGTLLFLTKYAVNIEHYTWDQRHFSFLFPLCIILLSILIHKLWSIAHTSFNRFLVLIFICIITVHITPLSGIANVLNMHYGQELTNSRYLVMTAESYRADYKTPFIYINQMYRVGDLVLVSDFGGSRFVDLYLNPDIPYETFDTESDALQEKITNYKNSRIWVVDITYDMEKHHAKYRWGMSYHFMQDNQAKIVYMGADKKTRVFLFEK